MYVEHMQILQSYYFVSLNYSVSFDS